MRSGTDGVDVIGRHARQLDGDLPAEARLLDEHAEGARGHGEPGGTGISAAMSSPSMALFPPNDELSSRRRAASGSVWPPVLTRASSPCRPTRRRGCAAPSRSARWRGRCRRRRGGVLAADDRGVRHDAADVRHRRLDLREDRRPGGRGDAADEDLALAHVADLTRRLDHARDPFDDARRGGVPVSVEPPRFPAPRRARAGWSRPRA